MQHRCCVRFGPDPNRHPFSRPGTVSSTGHWRQKRRWHFVKVQGFQAVLSVMDTEAPVLSWVFRLGNCCDVQIPRRKIRMQILEAMDSVPKPKPQRARSRSCWSSQRPLSKKVTWSAKRVWNKEDVKIPYAWACLCNTWSIDDIPWESEAHFL